MAVYFSKLLRNIYSLVAFFWKRMIYRPTFIDMRSFGEKRLIEILKSHNQKTHQKMLVRSYTLFPINKIYILIRINVLFTQICTGD